MALTFLPNVNNELFSVAEVWDHVVLWHHIIKPPLSLSTRTAVTYQARHGKLYLTAKNVDIADKNFEKNVFFSIAETCFFLFLHIQLIVLRLVSTS